MQKHKIKLISTENLLQIYFVALNQTQLTNLANQKKLIHKWTKTDRNDSCIQYLTTVKSSQFGYMPQATLSLPKSKQYNTKVFSSL